MTGKQTAVLWMGIILILIRLFTSGQWSSLWGTVVNTPASTTPPSAAHSSSENGATGSVPLNV